MKKIVIVFGCIAGIIVAALMLISLARYASMLLAFSLIFVAIKKYRDDIGNGAISFGKGFRIGLFITLIASTFYVGAWLLEYYFFIPDFMEKYSAYYMEKLKASGTPAAEMKSYAEMYKNPFFNAMMTYLEIIPVGLAVSLLCALILKKKPQVAM
jgi:hypothetical protein